jgi:hypothetical protein
MQVDMPDAQYPPNREEDAEILFARAMKACEPPKISGGSPERQAWMEIHIAIVAFLVQFGKREAVRRYATALDGEPHKF